MERAIRTEKKLKLPYSMLLEPPLSYSIFRPPLKAPKKSTSALQHPTSSSCNCPLMMVNNGGVNKGREKQIASVTFIEEGEKG